jgi:hypothetical protein
VVMASDTSEWTARAAMREMSLTTYRTLSDTADAEAPDGTRTPGS